MNNMLRFFFCTVLLFSFMSLPAQDTTITEVGPGFTHYQITLPAGPFALDILEIDLTREGNKLTTSLARNTLGTGFERTSSMAERHSRSGRIVAGAINGDYYGIQEPNNPFGFLSNSQILDGEYVFGRTHVRSSFGIKTETIPLVDIIDFSGSVHVKNDVDTSFTIYRINAQRGTDNLILYNQYIGTDTKTNEHGTEIRLQAVSDMMLNDTTFFRVVEKESGEGSMSVDAGDYILSGHGAARTFLNTFIEVDDTVGILLASAPDLGDITGLIGGGPRLVENGTRPDTFVGYENFGESHVNTRHPRTAVGFNEDSTKVYFVTVDGRQTHSVGMSLEELADFMISFGIHNGVNLDGGGSTTMVVRNTVANSPSDGPGNERSVANALIAYAEVDLGEVLEGFTLSPKEFLIDSTQSRRINISAVDSWGYGIEVAPADLLWEVFEINGAVDDEGFFTPFETGSGYVVGSYDDLRDTVFVTVVEDLIPTWEYSANEENLPAWFSETENTERGMAYGFVNDEHRVYLVNRPNISILNAATGDRVGTLDMAGVSGGTFPVNDVEVSEDGIIVAANLTIDAAGSPFRVYRWADESATAELLFQYSGSVVRLGDKFTLKGSFDDGSATIYAAASASNRVFLWSMEDGEFNEDPQVITLQGITNYGHSPAVEPRGHGSTNIFVNANGIRPMEFTIEGAQVATAPSGVVDSRSNAMEFLKTENGEFLMTYQYGFPNENAQVLDITDGLDNATGIEETPSLGENENIVGTSGDLGLRHYAQGTYILYVLGTNNGFGAYSMSLGSPYVSVDDDEYIAHSYSLYQNYPNPFNPVTTIRFSIPHREQVELTVYDLLGRKVETLIDEELNVGVHTVSFDASRLASGVYVYRLRAGTFVENKRMLFLK